MQSLLIDHLVEYKDGENIYFTLTCTICGAVWKSNVMSNVDRKAAAEEAAKRSHMCPFCGRLVCDNCFVDVSGVRLCAKCGQRLRQKLEA